MAAHVRVTETALEGVLAIEPAVFGDQRGFFFESWHAERYAALGLPAWFVQDNISRSAKGTLRGLHLQEPFGQGKLVQVLEGAVFDVAVDVRVGSPTFGRWVGETLSAENRRQFYIPTGFAHGFCVLSETALFSYKCTEYYHPETEITIAWNDPSIGITWPVDDPILSNRDRAGRLLSEVPRDRLPHAGRVETHGLGSPGGL
jgi:dTDP-4-dehydrorhamnose 3,5-epimerase